MSLFSIVTDPSAAYPAPGSAFSPHERYREYRHDLVAAEPNGVYAAVRQCFAAAGLDAARYGSAEWNPLGAYVPPGARVFVLCNFVYHRRPNESAEEFASKCTHASVIRAVIDYLLIAAGDSGSIAFGNSAVQSCRWRDVLRETGAQEIIDFYEARRLPVEACDLRMVIAERDALGNLTFEEARNMDAETRSIDLGAESLLDEVWSSRAPFRVQDYPPQKIESYHGKGRHAYVVHRRVLESDVIFSIPKLKTHEKVGMTCVIKGCVGTIGSKDCLAHHRFGGASRGGDEYPRDPSGILRLVSSFHDFVYRRAGRSRLTNVMRIVDHVVRRILKRIAPAIGGGWWGNDTAWRMAADLARIVEQADRNGTMTATQQRGHVALVDGVIGGEGEGPLKPSPVRSGTLIFADDPVVADYASAAMMGFDPLRVPALARLLMDTNQPMYDAARMRSRGFVNGNAEELASVKRHCRVAFRAPAGWKGRL